ncbi:MAG: dockerin type I domain-containing protein [Patescibacteria group bacterium]
MLKIKFSTSLLIIGLELVIIFGLASPLIWPSDFKNFDEVSQLSAVNLPGTSVTLLSSNPPTGAVDARETASPVSEPFVELNFSGVVSELAPSDFSISSSHPSPPVISRVESVSDSRGAKVYLNRQLLNAERLTLAHGPSASAICLGYLRGDVTGDGRVLAADVSMMNGVLAGTQTTLSYYSTDIDNNGRTDAQDLTKLNEIMAAPGLIRILPACPAPRPVSPPDAVPPQTITDLKLTGLYPNGQAGLNWRAPYENSNDPTSGKVVAYDIRYNLKTPVMDGAWSRAVKVTDEPAPRAPGTVEIYLLSNLPPGTYYVAIKSQDSAGNISALSNNLLVTIPILEPVIPEPVTPVQPMPSPSLSTFNMNIESVTQNGDTITVNTTGARYVLTSTGLEMWRRINPKTNSINPRKVATLSFSSNLGPLSIEIANNSKAIIQSSLATFEFMSDSLFFITAKSPFTYTHTNLVANASWNKGTGRDRMWADGYGGSLHARVSGGTTATNTADATTISMAANDVMAHMVFPPKTFDYESFYGTNAKPFIQYIFGEGSLSSYISNPNSLVNLKNEGYGIFVLFHTLYANGSTGAPSLLPSGNMGYVYNNESLVRQFVSAAHQNGFKVIGYSYGPAQTAYGGWQYPAGHPLAGQLQDTDITLDWMKNLQIEFDLNGWYFDNAEAGGFLDDYRFMRQIRTDVGDNGVIYHHETVDVWGQWNGLRAVMVDAYVNYTLAGEWGLEPPNLTAQIHDPNDPYFRFYSSGYGLSQSYGSHKRFSTMKLALSEGESARTAMENMVGMIDHSRYGSFWLNNIKPLYDVKKAAYLAGTLPTDVDWPVDPNTGWFRKTRNIRINYISGTSVNLTWQTSEPSTSEVAWSSNGVWWVLGFGPTGPDGRRTDNMLVTNHSVDISGLSLGVNYEFRIRSCAPSACETSPFNPATNDILTGKTVWGFLLGKDSDRDGLPDDWERQYFGNLNQSASGDPDNDGFSNVDEFANGTSPIIIPNLFIDIGPDIELIELIVPVVPHSPSTSLQPITDLRVVSTTEKSAILTWVAPNQNFPRRSSTAVSSYDLRYSRDPITEANWDSSAVAQASGEPRPTTPGQTQSYVLVDLGADKSYHAAIKSRDAAGNFSPLSNLVLFNTAAEPPLSGSDDNNTGRSRSGSSRRRDLAPPDSPANATISGADRQAVINWQNPSDSDFVRVLILRSTTLLPVITVPGNPRYLPQAIIVYDGVVPQFTDTNLINGQLYYYTLYAYDRSGNYAQPVTLTVTPAGNSQIALSPAQFQQFQQLLIRILTQLLEALRAAAR